MPKEGSTRREKGREYMLTDRKNLISKGEEEPQARSHAWELNYERHFPQEI